MCLETWKLCNLLFNFSHGKFTGVANHDTPRIYCGQLSNGSNNFIEYLVNKVYFCSSYPKINKQDEHNFSLGNKKCAIARTNLLLLTYFDIKNAIMLQINCIEFSPIKSVHNVTKIKHLCNLFRVYEYVLRPISRLKPHVIFYN